MRTTGKTHSRSLFYALLLGAGLGVLSVPAHAQIPASGQPLPPGIQNQPGATGPCTGVDAGGMPLNPNDTSCGALPGFATPSTNTPIPAPPPRTVLAVVRVASTITKPATTPFPMDFTAVGSATMVTAKMTRLNACFTAGKVLSDRSGAATSTTCMDYRGEVMAYQECKPKSGDTPMVCSAVLPSEASSTTGNGRP